MTSCSSISVSLLDSSSSLSSSSDSLELSSVSDSLSGDSSLDDSLLKDRENQVSVF